MAEAKAIPEHDARGLEEIKPPLAAEPSPPAPETPPATVEERPPAEVTARGLGSVLDDALMRMERRALGDESPITLPWTNVSAALGGGLWGGTLVALVGDTGSGKTQWALQASVHAAESGFPVCYVAPDSGTDAIVARILALKAGRKWSDLYVGRSGKDILDQLREQHASALKALPFQIFGGSPARGAAPDVRKVTAWMRAQYPEGKPGTRPMLIVLDFVQIVDGAGRDRDDVKEMMGRAAYEARKAARDFGAVALLVSTTSREMRPEGEDSIGIHHDRRQPTTLGRGNPARLVLSGKDVGEVEQESDTVLVLAQEPWRGPKGLRRWTKVWCAVAKNRAGSRAWCALRFNGSTFDVDLETSVVPDPDSGGGEEEDGGRDLA